MILIQESIKHLENGIVGVNYKGVLNEEEEDAWWSTYGQNDGWW